MKNIQKYIEKFIYVVIFFIIVSCEGNSPKYTEESMDYDQSIRGIGVGTAVVISFIIIGAIIIVYGLSTPYPVLFIIIGVGLPLIVLLILIFVPQSDKKEEEEKSKSENTHKDVYMIAKWIYFSIMLALFIGIMAIEFILFTVVVIPERVDSRAQKEMDRRYLAQLENKRKKKEELFVNRFNEEEVMSVNKGNLISNANSNNISGINNNNIIDNSNDNQ